MERITMDELVAVENAQLCKWEDEMTPHELALLDLFNKVNAGKGALKLMVEVAVVDKITGLRSQVKRKMCDVGTVQFMQLIAGTVFNTTQSNVIKDTTNTTRTHTAGDNITAVNVVAGTAGTTAAVTDYQINTKSGGGQGTQTGSVGAVNTGTGVLQITANMAAPGSTIVYKEIGIECVANTYNYLVARDYNGTGWSVDTSHYLAVTYTLTPS